MGVAFSNRSQRNSRLATIAIPAWLAIYWLSGVLALPAGATTYTWTNASVTNSNWNNSGNWSPTGFPSLSADEAIITPGALGTNGPVVVPAVSLGVANIDVLEVSGVDGEIQVLAGANLSFNGGDLTNDGLVYVNSNGGTTATTTLLFAGFMGDVQNTISGTGTIHLQAGPQGFPFTSNPARIVTSGSVLTQEAGHTIRGIGLISTSMVNNGAITADNLNALPGDNRLELSGGSMTNNGTLSAESGGMLDIVGTYWVTQGATGVIQALDGGTVRLRNWAIIQNGTLQTKGTGVILNTTGSADPYLWDVTNEGMYRINSSATTRVNGNGLTNNGEVHVMGTLFYQQSGFLDGKGDVVLNAGNTGISAQSGTVITHGADHTIRGRGQVFAETVNNGTIRAEGGTLRLLFYPMTNNHEMRAASGATLSVETNITQDPNDGVILAEDGGTVRITHASSSKISGGRIDTDGTGIVRVFDNAQFNDVVNHGDITVQRDQTIFATLAIQGASFTNNGTITVNPFGTGGTHQLSFVGDPQMSLDGTGTVELNSANARLNVQSGITLTNEAGHTIRGNGAVLGTVVNEGTLGGNSSLAPIRVEGHLSGTGLLEHVRIAGTHAPGNNGPATANVNGLYEILPGGKYEMEIGGPNFGSDYDWVDILGTAALAGTLEVEFINGYVPTPNTGFSVLLASGGLGGTTFTNEVLPDLYGGLYLDVQYTANQVVLAIEGILGDYNLDGKVSAADYTVWRDTLGSTTDMRANGDFGGSSAGVIDMDDYDVWLTNFGMTAPGAGTGSSLALPPSPLASVPEPTSLTLLCIVAPLAFRSRHPVI